MERKEVVVTYYPDIHLEEMKNTTKKFYSGKSMPPKQIKTASF
jgi:hypothetical protein